MKHNIFEKNARQKGMVRYRGGFSDVNGIAPCNTELQVNELDDETRIQLNNQLYKLLDLIMKDEGGCLVMPASLQPKPHVFCLELLNDVFCDNNILEDGYYYDWHLIYKHRIEQVILNSEYNEVFDTLEYICNWINKRTPERIKNLPYDEINIILEKEYVGYRFVGGKIVPITYKAETQSIHDALALPFIGCRIHIQKAMGFISDRKNPDYKNCIKESISAVESVCQQITGDNKASLGDALRKLEKNGITLHPSLKSGFSKLYGYTSDQGGIRHAEGMYESNVTFEDAKYMLVSCSAFVNYLIAVSGKGSN